MIVLNEYDWAEDAIKSRTLGKKPYETLCRVAKYYMDVCGNSKSEARQLLDAFLIQCEPTASLAKWSNTLDYAVARATKYKAIVMDCVYITNKEINVVNSLQGRQVKRLAFTLLCLAKYWDTVNPNGDHWVNTKDSEIMRMANINTSIKRQSIMYHDLCEAGLIQFSKKVDNTNVRVLFVDESADDIFAEVQDFRNIGYQYMMLCGEPYFTCQSCGITTKIEHPSAGRKQIFCKECASRRKMESSVNSVMRHRRT